MDEEMPLDPVDTVFLKLAQEIIDKAVTSLSELRMLLVEEQKRRGAISDSAILKGSEVPNAEEANTGEVHHAPASH